MCQTKFNGWTNYETWYVACIVLDMAQEDLIDAFSDEQEARYWFEDLLESLEKISVSNTPIAMGMVSVFLDEVNWKEIMEIRDEMMAEEKSE